MFFKRFKKTPKETHKKEKTAEEKAAEARANAHRLEQQWPIIKEEWREMNSHVSISTTSGTWDALELLSRKHDSEFVDPQEVHAESVKQLFTRTGNRYLPVFLEIMKDRSYDWLTRVYALEAASMTKNEHVRNAFREMADDERTLPQFAKYLASAFYRQEDREYLEKICSRTDIIQEKDIASVKFPLEALSRKVDRGWCTYLDEHGVCVKKADICGCGPVAYAGGSISSNVVKVPPSYNYRTCPTYTSPSPY